MFSIKTWINIIVMYLSDKSFRGYCDNKLNPPQELFGDRSPQWRKVRDAHVKNHPNCAVCGTKDELNVHHIVPFHIDNSLELEESNLITLCNKNGCHFAFGHLYNWKSYNKNVISDVKNYRDKVISRP
jgi:5-methylcytosine-specific restriction enzyme A